MKVLSLKTKKTYEIHINRSGENNILCPECNDDRKKKNAKSLSYNGEKGVGRCHHCLADFVEWKPQQEKKQYNIPEWKNKTQLTEQAAKWFRDRGVMDEVLNLMQVSSSTEWMPQTEKDRTVICFPYIKSGKIVNVKYRDGAKNFKLNAGSELVFYNIDSLKDQTECVIVEGEIDCLSFIQSGIKNVVSVPNGAGSTSLEYVDNCYYDLERIEKFYIGVDTDPAGFRLRDELIRRFGAERCSIINYKDCKDANEYLVKYGAFDLGEILSTAKDVPVEGVIFQSDIYDNIYSLFQKGLEPGKDTQIASLDEIITWEPGRIAVFTGIPGHGKSEIVDYIVCRLNMIHGWKAAYYSPENYPLELHYSKIASKISGKTFSSKFIGRGEFERTFEYINNNFFFIYPEEDITVDNILTKGKYLVRRYGINILVVDPYNKLDHSRDRNESETEYISRFLDKISMFSKQHNCLVILVAHPRKMDRKRDDGNKYEVPTLYDINGSANFYNKADYGLIVYRDYNENSVKVIVSKVKFKHLGMGGEAHFTYNTINGRLTEYAKEPDFESYLNKQWETPEKITLELQEVPF